MSAPEPDEEREFLPAEDVVENLREYTEMLAVEREVIEAVGRRLEDGTLAVEEMLEVMPETMPLEDWQRNEFDATADYLLADQEDTDGGQ